MHMAAAAPTLARIIRHGLNLVGEISRSLCYPPVVWYKDVAITEAAAVPLGLDAGCGSDSPRRAVLVECLRLPYPPPLDAGRSPTS